MTLDNISCPSCSSKEFDVSLEELDGVCAGCGFVVSDSDEIREVRYQDEKMSESEGGSGCYENTWDDVYRTTNSTEKQVAIAFEALETMADELDLSMVVRKKAAQIYSHAMKKQVTDGRPTDLIVCSALNVAMREVGEPRPLVIVADAIDRDEDKISSTSRLLQRELGLEQPLCDPEEYLPYLSRKTAQSTQTEKQAAHVLNDARDNGLINGKSPVGLAGAAVYWVADDLSQREAAHYSGVSKETIRIRVKDFESVVSGNG